MPPKKRKAKTPERKLAEAKKLPPLKAIRAKCIDCCAGQRKEVALCTAKYCDLWPYRMGTDPYRGQRK